MENDDQRGAARGGLSQRTVEVTAAIVIFLIGIVMIVDNYKLGAGWAKDGPQAGYFPLRIGVIICIASTIVLLRSLFGKDRGAKVFVTAERFKLVLKMFVPTLAYVLVIQLAGIYVASALFIGSFMRAMGNYDWLKSVAVSLGVTLMLFWLFEVQFLVPLPKGPLEALFGY